MFIESDDLSELVPGYSVDAVATVGAGDAFNGGLGAGLAMGLDLIEAARLGVATSALSVTRPGAQASMPSRAEVQGLRPLHDASRQS